MAFIVSFLVLIILAQLGLIWGLTNRLLVQSRLPQIDLPVPATKANEPEKPDDRKKLFRVQVQG